MVTNLPTKYHHLRTYIKWRIVEMLLLSTNLPNPFIKGEQLKIQMEYLL